MKITIDRLFDAVPALATLARQKLPLAQAEKIADFNEAISKLLDEVELRRQEILAGIVEGEEDTKEAAQKLFESLAKESREIPDLNIKEFSGLELTAQEVFLLRRLGVA